MNKTGIIHEVGVRAGLTEKESALAVEAVINIITECLEKGEKVNLTHFGVFDTRKREGREIINPKTGILVPVTEGRAPQFRPARALRDRLLQTEETEATAG